MIQWLIDNILKALDYRTILKVLVHEGFIIGDTQPYYFVKIINLSREKEPVITHIWARDVDKEIDLINPQRPLPYKLGKSAVWETWFSNDLIRDTNKIFTNVNVEISDGKIYKSHKNLRVRPVGFIAH